MAPDAPTSSPTEHAAAADAPRRVPFLLWLVPAVLALAFLTHRAQLGLGLVGHDTFPVILTAKVESFADLVDTVSTKLMEERFDLDYYRPVLNLSVALDEALFGLDPAGYQASSIVLFALATLALAVLARRALGGSAWIGPTLAALVFLLHPSHVDVLPIVPRRHEVLACLFLCLALAPHASRAELARGRPLLLPALFAALAMGSKETAIVTGPLAALTVVLFSERSGLAPRLRHALVVSAPVQLALVAMFAFRWQVLGGIGGPDREVGLTPAVAGDILWSVLLPGSATTLGMWLVLGAAFVLLGAGRVALRVPGEDADPATRERARRRLATAGLGIALSLGTALLHSLGGRHQPWYEFLPLVGYTLFLAAIVEGLVAAARSGASSAEARRWSGAALLFVAALSVAQARHSPLVTHYAEWETADRLLDRFLRRLEPILQRARPGTRVKCPSVPMRVVAAEGSGPSATDAAILAERSVQAWAELRFPERQFLVVGPDDPPDPRPRQTVVVYRRLKNVHVGASDVDDDAETSPPPTETDG